MSGISGQVGTRTRPDFSCWIKIDDVSEEKLLAAIAYGESSTIDNYEEMVGIAYAVIRRRNAARKSSVALLLKAFPSFSYVTSDRSHRYRKGLLQDVYAHFSFKLCLQNPLLKF